MRGRSGWALFPWVLFGAATLSTSAASCAVDTIPEGARRTPAGDGPRVVFDMNHRPLPDVPLPNDVATFADPTSRTGRRVNVSLSTPTRFETAQREGFAAMEGWGTFAPITVSFRRSDDTAEVAPALDLDDIAARTVDYEPADDPFYLVDLETGAPVALDMGKGNFPLALVNPTKFWPNDPRASEDTLLFETVEEGAGLPQSAYRPELDTDFDGVLDHPNVRGPSLASTPSTTGNPRARIEDVLSWYERETDTLRLRPVVPLREMHEYAVVLTDRLKSASGRAVRSPFDSIHHAEQRRGADRVAAIFSDPTATRRFGDLAGTGLAHVAFTWTFTTQPVYDDLRRIRDGLHGTGPFARLATDFPVDTHALRAVGTSLDPADERPGAMDGKAICNEPRKTPYIIRVSDVKDTLKQVLEVALGFHGEELRAIGDSLDDVDHFVVGTFDSPYFMGDPEHEDPDGRFTLDYRTGEGRVNRDQVQYWVSVPKVREGMAQPFPTTMWAHGTALHGDELIIRAGYFARRGIAMMGINMPGHGLYLEPSLKTLASVLFGSTCMTPFVTAMSTGRARDLNGDGAADSGGLLFTAHLFHTRDNIRQSVVDEMQAVRVLRSWDGVRRSDQDYNADGTWDLAGDFDGNGVPDLGGPNVPITTSGNSYGGIVAMIHGAVDTDVSATASISGGGGVADIAARSELVTDTVLEQVFTPLVVSVPASSRPPRDGERLTNCGGDQRSVRLVVNDLIGSKEIEIACLTPAELGPGKTVVLENVRNGEKRCARTDVDGRFRVPIPANVDDLLDVQIYDAPDAVISYKGCQVLEGAPVGRRIKTFEQPAPRAMPIADEEKSCERAVADYGAPEDLGCAQFRDHFFPVGSPLVAPQEGLGLYRQSPEARRLLDLAQAALDPGDPVNYAARYALEPAPGLDGKPLPARPFAEFNTAGDFFVPSATGYAFARAAGAVPFLPPSFATDQPAWAEFATPPALYEALGRKTPNEVLIDNFVLEGLARLGRTHAGPTCAANYQPSAVCTSAPSTRACATALYDADWLSEGKNLWDAPHPPVPLRLGRTADTRVTGAEALTATWAPRLAGAPFGPDDAYVPGSPLLAVANAWIDPGGTHVFVNADPCKAFDDVAYHVEALVQFLASGGKDLYWLRKPTSHACLATRSCTF